MNGEEYTREQESQGALQERKEQKEHSWKRDFLPPAREGSGLVLLLLALFFGIPTAISLIQGGFSLILGILGGILGIFAGLFGLVFAAFGAAIGLLFGGVEMMIKGARHLSAPAYGTLMIGGGFLMAALSLAAAALGKWGCSAVIPGLFRFLLEQLRRLYRRLERGFGRWRRKGGDSQ